MKEFAIKHPVIFELILIAAGFALALIFSLGGYILQYPGEVNISVGRLLAALVIFIVFARSFSLKKQLTGFVIMLPALLFALWNVAYHYLTKGPQSEGLGCALLFGLAPAVFEELIFRGIFIENMKARGMRPMAMLLISAIVFGAVHLTNIAGMTLADVLVQVLYALVIGLVLGAVYIRSGDLVSVIIAHAAVDICSRLFPGGESTPIALLALFFLLLTAETGYALWLTARAKDGSDGDGDPRDAAIQGADAFDMPD
ncbi:MAG: CPBP family intramembrane metalloprotease [Oscillospiraceae bacterium]|nr:CPBP family intramembrane metalloprotease [Oscillospiraceae bacterium]